MKNYYLLFNDSTHKVDVFRKTDDSLVQSTEVINGIVSWADVKKIAFALHMYGKRQIEELDYEIFCEDRDGREFEEESLQEV